MNALRILGIALGLMLALLAAGVGVLSALFDGEKIRVEAKTEEVKDKAMDEFRGLFGK